MESRNVDGPSLKGLKGIAKDFMLKKEFLTSAGPDGALYKPSQGQGKTGLHSERKTSWSTLVRSCLKDLK